MHHANDIQSPLPVTKMTPNFSIKPLPAISFGIGCLDKLTSITESLGSRFLVVIGDGFRGRQISWISIENKLLRAGTRLTYVHISAEPTPEVIDTIVTSSNPDEIDGVVAIGGGSVLDTGKAIAAMLPAGEKIEQFLEGVGSRTPDGRKLPFVAVPTTAGTGSEASANAVITKPGPNGYKKSLRHQNYVPDFALIDPELMRTCPPALTAACSMDAFTQLVEAFLSTQSSPITDAIAWSGIEALQRSLVQAYQNGNDLGARSDTAYAALCSGIVLANAGLGVIHGLAPALGSRFCIPHGVACGTLMGAGNEITLRKLNEFEQSDSKYQPFLNKYHRLGCLFSRQRTEVKTEANYFIEEVHRIIDLLKLPRLSDFGAKPEDLAELLDAASNKNNPVELSREDIQNILLQRL